MEYCARNQRIANVQSESDYVYWNKKYILFFYLPCYYEYNKREILLQYIQISARS